jgi:hypothetical protein
MIYDQWSGGDKRQTSPCKGYGVRGLLFLVILKGAINPLIAPRTQEMNVNGFAACGASIKVQ